MPWVVMANLGRRKKRLASKKYSKKSDALKYKNHLMRQYTNANPRLKKVK